MAEISTQTTLQRGTERRNLRLLVRLRWLALTAQTGAILLTHYGLGIPLPVLNLAGVLAMLTAVNLVATLRLRRAGGVPVQALTADILVDVTGLTLLLWLTGGASNPFSGLFMLQAIVAAFLLPPIEAGVVFCATVAAQFWLLGHGLPLALPMSHDGTPGRFDLHLQGMFLSFFLSAALAVWFILGIRENLRQRDATLAALARQIEEEAIVLRLGLMAGSAAHDLGTPLTSLAVLLDDWNDFGPPEGEELHRQTALMQEAVASCRASLSQMLKAGGQARLEAAGPCDAAAFAAGVAQDWQRGQTGLTVTLDDRRDHPAAILADVLLRRSLANLLDNAREAGATRATLTIATAGATPGAMVSLSVTDNGPGFPPQVLSGAATLGDHEDPARLRGLGLLLAQSALRRLGGGLSLENPPEGGARATITLPGLPAHG